jgi:hypothetical protein
MPEKLYTLEFFGRTQRSFSFNEVSERANHRQFRRLHGSKSAQTPERSGFFENAKRADEFAWHHVVANIKINERTGSLHAILAVGGLLHGSHAVGFSTSVYSVWVGNYDGAGLLNWLLWLTRVDPRIFQSAKLEWQSPAF